MDRRAYLDALKMLARRELSEAQLRQRLVQKGYEADEMDAVLARLRRERVLDDLRAAEAIARTETTVKRHGKLRVRKTIERAGIAGATARRAADEVFRDVDTDALIETSLMKRLRGRNSIIDERELRRLFRYLVGQGFEPDRVFAALNRHKGHQGHKGDEG